MAGYQAYPEYKDSGVEWLGGIPKNWKTVRLKHLAYIRNGKDYKDVVADEGYPVIGSGGEFATASEYLYKGESVLLGRKGTIDRPLYIDSAFWTVDTMFYTEVSPLTSAKYLYYCALTINFGRYVTSTALPSMTQQDLGNILFAVPVLEEQQTIARFLDHKTAQIDTLIAKKEAILEKLAEKRTALISHAVTKGHNPQVKMKESGVEWLGKVPAHWGVKRLRFCVSMNPSKSEITLSNDSLASFVPMDAVGEYGGIRLDEEEKLSEIGSGYTYFANEDVIVAKITPCFENGKGAIARNLINGIAFGTTELHVIRVGEEVLPEYLFHLTMSHPFKMIGESEMYGAGGQKRVPENFIKDFRIGVPPLQEQEQIVGYINKKNGLSQRQFDKAIETIEKLKEYRSALITQAVTGKIDVRKFTIPDASEKEQIA